MTLDAFKKRVAGIEDETEADDLCINWLKSLARDHGRDGKIAMALLDQIKILVDA